MVRFSTQYLTFSLLCMQSGIAQPTTDNLQQAKEALNFLERRQSSCPSSSPLSCQAVDSKLPNNFCCSTGTSCISLDSSSTALCCPSGSTCTVIQPIDCDVSLEDPTKHRDGPVFTTRLTEKLATCGDKCCPFGYTCAKGTDGSATCQIIANKAVIQSTTSSASVTSASTSAARSSVTSASLTTSATSTPSAVSTASSSGIDSTRPQEPQSSNPFPPTVFLAGFFPGMLVGALGVLAWVVITGRHRKSDDSASVTSSIYKKKPYISGPMPIESQSARTDFLRKSNEMAKSAATSLFGKKNQPGGTPGLPFDTWKTPTPPESNNTPDRSMGWQMAAGRGAESTTDATDYATNARYPVTPEHQIYGEKSNRGQETIHVYTPRGMEIPPAAVTPLRGMNSKNRVRGSEIGNTSTTTDRTLNTQTPKQTAKAPVPPHGDTYETLTPARYEGGSTNIRNKVEGGGQQNRPETTFTTMLEAINFPDPMKQNASKVPEIPKQYRR